MGRAEAARTVPTEQAQALPAVWVVWVEMVAAAAGVAAAMAYISRTPGLPHPHSRTPLMTCGEAWVVQEAQVGTVVRAA